MLLYRLKGDSMNYIITSQYARGEETRIAGFSASHDGVVFLNKKNDNRPITKQKKDL